MQGDLTTSDLDDLAAEAPKDATLVIFHTAVLFYVPRVGRAIFRARVRELGATWLACERVAHADGHGGSLSWG